MRCADPSDIKNSNDSSMNWKHRGHLEDELRENLQEIRWALTDSAGMDREPRTARFMSATNSLQVSLSYIREVNALSARCAAFLPYLPLVPCAPAQILSHGKGGFGAIELSLLSVTFWPPITTVFLPAAVLPDPPLTLAPRPP